MRQLSVLAAALLAALTSAAHAAPVSVTVVGSDGRPLAGAVVTVESSRAPAAASVLTGPFTMAQKDISFQPHVLVVPVGASVSFPNRDKVRHHVYSFSAAKRFELKLYGRDETRSVVFDKAGVVALGCNIHDVMSGFIVVVDTPFAAQTDARGRVAFDIPPGPVRLVLWHPLIRAPDSMLSQAVTVAAQGLSTTLTVRR